MLQFKNTMCTLFHSENFVVDGGIKRKMFNIDDVDDGAGE